MIRFACLGCEATYTVPAEKAGKTGKCPKCHAQFVIPTPDPTATAAPPPRFDPPPPAATSNAEVEIAPCPQCRSRLMVAATDLGGDVECPYCQAVYRAETAAAREADGDRPRRRPAAESDDRPARRRRDEYIDEDDEPRPRRKRSRRAREEAASAATTGMVLGIVALIAWLCPITGFVFGGLAVRFGLKAKELSDGELGTGGVVMGYVALGLSMLNCVGGAILKIKG